MSQELYKDKLQILSEDELALKAIYHVFNEICKPPEVGAEDNNNLLGQKYRAYVEARKMFHELINNIKAYKPDRTNEPSFDKAR